MAFELRSDTTVFVVGAGIMGAGIAQVAAQAGHRVRLYDTRDGAAQAACAKLAATLDGLAAKGKLEGAQANQMIKLMEALEDHDDVQKVSANFDMSEADMAAA